MPYYDPSGQEISLPQWATLKSTLGSRPFFQAWRGSLTLRTYWRGTDLDCCGDEPAQFETTLSTHQGREEVIKRHSRTEADAKAVHDELRQGLEAGTVP